MAIDDNTIYGLTGAQVKELPGKIEAVKGQAKVLTTDDYNWPTTGTKTSVALWLLEPGLYRSDGTADVRWTTTGSAHQTSASPLYLVSAESFNERHIIRINTTDSAIYTVDSSTGAQRNQDSLVTSIVDNLTSTSTTSALSANQGKVLKDSIGDLTNLTTTDKTNLVAAINEAAASGGGGIIELTSADYNWNATAGAATEPYDCIAPWLLPEGVYAFNSAYVVLYPSANQTRYNDVEWMIAGEIPIIGSRQAEIQQGPNFYRLSMSYSNGSISSVSTNRILDSIIDNLTSTSTNSPLSAKQGKVLKDLIDALDARVSALEGN